MTETAKYKGSQLAQNGFPLSNMIASDAKGLEFLSGGDDMPRIAEATLTHYPVESDDVLWASVEADLTMQNIGDATPAQLILSLYGITCHGDINLLGEKVFNSIPTTLTDETINFDLLKSACEASLNVESEQTTAGEIQLNLPYRTNYYESLLLNYGVYTGWKRLKTVPVTGNRSAAANIPVLITVPYDSDMNNDFSDIRFVDWNGNLLDYGLISKTDGSTATFAVKLNTTPASGITSNITIWYKNSTATSISDQTKVFTYFDGFEDNLLTGRDSRYYDISNWYGTLSITNTNPTSGSYSLKHIGDGTNHHSGWIYSNKTLGNSFSLEFNVKLLTQGTGANTPYVSILYIQYNNYQNWLRIATWWNGTNQVIGLQQNVAGTITTLGSQIMIAGAKWGAPNTKTFRIIRSDSSHWGIQVGGGRVLYVTGNPGFTEVWGGAAQMDSQALWDDIKAYPYIGTVPTVGTLSAEKQGAYSGTWTWQSILSDSLVAEATNALFTTPTMDINAPAYITTNEYNRYVPYDSPKVQINDKSILNLGYHGLDCYDALRLNIQSLCNADYYYNISEVRFKYEL